MAAVSDQGIAAATPAVTVALLARLLPPAGFGSFVLLGTVTAAGLAVLGAVVLDPLAVRGRGRPVDHALAALLLGGLTLAGGAAALVVGGVATALAAAPALALLTLARREAHRRQRPGEAACLGAVALTTSVLALGCLAWSDALTPPRAVLAGTAATLLAALPGLTGWPWRAARRRRAWGAAWLRHRRLGGWLLLAAGPWWVAAQAPLVLLAAAHGPTEAGALRVLLLLAAPVSLLTAGVGTLMQPRLARLGRWQPRAMRRAAWGTGAAVAGLALPWLLAVLTTPETWVALAGGESWRAWAPWAGVAVMLAVGKAFAAGPDLALRAQGDGRAVALATLAAAVAGGGVGWVLVPALGLPGALAALGVAAATSFACQGAALAWRHAPHPRARTPRGATATESAAS